MSNDFVSEFNRQRQNRRGIRSGSVGKRPVPVLPVRETVLFPHAVLPLTVGRDSSIQLIHRWARRRRFLWWRSAMRVRIRPRRGSISVGTRATVHKVVKMPNQSLFVLRGQRAGASGRVCAADGRS